MIIKHPACTQPLRQLWKQAFGDPDSFLDDFFSLGYSRDRCFQAETDGNIAGALYWFDCSFDGKKIAYLYAVATHQAYRNQGVCRALMAHTHSHLKNLGYAGAILVPAKEDLFSFYKKLGYTICSTMNEITCAAGKPVDLQEIDSDEYARLRKKMLPAGGVVQEGAGLDFLRSQVSFYKGENILLCAAVEGSKAIVPELLGGSDHAPGIVAALGAAEGFIRTPGSQRPFAMYYPLADSSPAPNYFSLAFD